MSDVDVAVAVTAVALLLDAFLAASSALRLRMNLLASSFSCDCFSDGVRLVWGMGEGVEAVVVHADTVEGAADDATEDVEPGRAAAILRS